MSQQASTIGELKASGWVSRPVKDELRANAVARISAGEPLFPRVLGYEDTVLPQLENALLAGHDVIFLGERGQAVDVAPGADEQLIPVTANVWHFRAPPTGQVILTPLG